MTPPQPPPELLACPFCGCDKPLQRTGDKKVCCNTNTCRLYSVWFTVEQWNTRTPSPTNNLERKEVDTMKCQRIGGCLHDIGMDKCCCDDNSCDGQVQLPTPSNSAVDVEKISRLCALKILCEVGEHGRTLMIKEWTDATVGNALYGTYFCIKQSIQEAVSKVERDFAQAELGRKTNSDLYERTLKELSIARDLIAVYADRKDAESARVDKLVSFQRQLIELSSEAERMTLGFLAAHSWHYPDELVMKASRIREEIERLSK